MDGKVLPLSEFKPGITAPPLHCHCRSTTCPYFDDEFTENETRAARDPKTGKSVQVDSKLSYEEWKKKCRFVNHMLHKREAEKESHEETSIRGDASENCYTPCFSVQAAP